MAFFLGLWLVLMIGGRERFFRDPGTFWHVAVGNRLLAEGFFDREIYSFTMAERTWIPHQWLGEGAMALVYKAFGFDGLLLAAVAIIAGLFTGLGVRLWRAGLHPSVVCVFIAAGLAASAMHFHIRPHLATMVGMAVVMVFLTDYEAKRITIRRLWWLVPIVWLWANCHGGVLGGLVTMALAGSGWVLARLCRLESPLTAWRDLWHLLMIFIVCVAACFVNPYYDRLPKVWIDIYRMASLPEIIEEHAPLRFSDVSGMTVLAFAGLYLVLLMGLRPRQNFRVTWLLPVVWGLLAYTRIRHAPLFAVISLVALADFFPLTRYAERLVRKKSDLYVPPNDEPTSASEEAKAFAIPAAILGMALLLQLAGFVIPVVGRDWASFDRTRWPIELLPELRDNQYLRPTGTRIFNEFNYGGLLILQTPGYRVFVDDRCELYGDAFLVQFTSTRLLMEQHFFEHPGEPFAEWQAEYGAFDMALVETDGPFDRALYELEMAWEEVKRTPTATLYRKRYP